MRKTLIFTLILVAAMATHAQETTFKPFKFDIAAGYAIPSGHGLKGGVIFALEPRYALNDFITVGLRLQDAVTVRTTVDSYGEAMDADAKASGSYLLTGDYYFNTNYFRPFFGIGAGIFKLAAVSTNSDEIQTGTKFGFTPRAGFEVGHFRTAIEYNAVGKTENFINSYVGIKMGFFIGGGRYEY